MPKGTPSEKGGAPWPAPIDRLGKLIGRLGWPFRAQAAAEAKQPAPTRAAAGSVPRVAAVATPPGADQPSTAGRFLAATCGVATGARDYRLYLPAVADRRPLSLLVMLHGCTQTPEDFALGTRMNELAEAQGVIVLYPSQSPHANPQRCWNWFNPADQARGAGEPALVAAMVREVMRQHAVDPCRVYIAGLSAGGAAAAVLAETYPDLFVAVAVHSGLPCGVARDLPTALAAMQRPDAGLVAAHRLRLPTIVFHGARDTTVHPRNGDLVIAQAEPGGLAVEVEHGQQPGGHRWRRTLHRDQAGRTVLEQWLVEDAGHAWSGGSRAGSFTDPAGPDASRAILRFFLAHARDAG